MEENDIYSISAINNLIDKKISYCDDFKKIKIRGEITNFNGSYNSGHYYFSLKDKNSSISCVMFKLSTKSLDFEPKNGVDVVASGEVSFYKVRGNLQFRVRKMQEAGLGDLYIAFEKLKKKLDKEGLFKDKKAIPQYPKKIGVITSASGKAVKDIVNNIEKRWPAEIIVWNTTVQGANSTRSITKNIALANKTDVDVIIVGRGGGSTQDLWDFNKEEVVRSIANSKKPVITAIGHSTDKTLSDLASDKVAATPTKAAELVVPNKVELNEKLKNIETRLNDLINSKLDNLTHKLRICSYKMFDKYFELTLNENEMSNIYFEMIIQSEDYDFIKNEILKNDIDGKSEDFLEKLRDNASKIDSKNIKLFLRLLYDIGDNLNVETGTIIFSKNTLLLQNIGVLSKLLNNKELYDAMDYAIKNAEDCLYLLVNDLSIHDKNNQRYRFKNQKSGAKKELTNEQLDKLQKQACIKIKQWANNGKLFKVYRTIEVIYNWYFWDTEEYNKFTEKTLENDSELIKLIKIFINISKDDNEVNYDFNFSIMEKICPIQKIYNRINNIIPKIEDKNEQKICRSFIEKYNLNYY